MKNLFNKHIGLRLVIASWGTAAICAWALGVAGASLPAANGSTTVESQVAASFTLPAFAYDRGTNIRVRLVGATPWTDTQPMLHCTGQFPAEVEYDFELPAAAVYTASVLYSAATERPLEVSLDGRRLGLACRKTTGGWNTSQAQWEPAFSLECAPGKHTLKLWRNAGFPHLTGLRIEASVPFPPGWKLQRPGARKLPEVITHVPTSPSFAALRLAVEDLHKTYGERYAKADWYLQRLNELEPSRLRADGDRQKTEAAAVDFETLARAALLANPLLDFGKLLLVKRPLGAPNLGLPQNWQSNSSLPRSGYDDSLEILPLGQTPGGLRTLFKPSGGRFAGDVDLHFDAGRLLFSMPDDRGRFQVFEIGVDGQGLRALTGTQPDVDSYDACYLPNGQIIFSSTACFNAVPCTGIDDVAVLYLMDGDGKNIRQLGFDQDHDWCPTVLNNGRVLYTRWEYTDLVHCHSRRLFQMNPDGTGQREFYGSNSYWPNAIFFARPIPDHPTQVVAVISGHHGDPRMGELVILDPARGRHEASGAVQRIPGCGKKVERVMKDQLATDSWPKFLHPYPLSGKYFLVSAKPTPDALWGAYLADVFDNLVLIKELPGFALLEPIPLRPTSKPPTIPNQVDALSTEGLVFIQDIYAGRGLHGIPRGTVKALRVITYHFGYRGMESNPNIIGVDGPWDIKRVLGTVPVQADGSARFLIPANTPISLQPLDAEGQAIQLMRSWLTAMPGEHVACIGCHEGQNGAPPQQAAMAARLPPAEIKPWFGPARGFSFRREIQPVLDRYCIGCHHGGEPARGGAKPDLRGDLNANDYASTLAWQRAPYAGKFSVAYVELQRFVRRPGAESDMHLLEPMEFHAGATELVQLLRKGHYGVDLDPEAWDRLITWIDLNCPFHGTRHEELSDPGNQRQRRRELLKLYAGVEADPEAIPPAGTGFYNSGRKVQPVSFPLPPQKPVPAAGADYWAFGPAEARSRQSATGSATRRNILVGKAEQVEMALVPAGEFAMGSAAGPTDEQPVARVRIGRPFWISTHEISNRQFQQFQPTHDSRVESKNATQYGVQGYPANEPEQPVVRVSWEEAMAFCRWLSGQLGIGISLPTEAQWEYSARAGTATPFYYGGLDDDFSGFANLADAKLAEFASDVWDNSKPLASATRYDEWFPKDTRFNDGALVSVPSGRYRPNAWGLYDMHGNVSEWTRSAYHPYPGQAGDGRNDPAAAGLKVVRGGSWFDRPQRSTASFRLAYQPYQRVFNVGFRIVCEEPPPNFAGPLAR